VIACPRCNWDNPDGIATCIACGGALTASQPAANDTDQEREMRRAAQRERREREEAHRRALQQAAQSEREAREVASRVAALVVHAAPNQTQAEETIRRATGPGDGPVPASSPTPVQPTKGVQPYRPRTPQPAATVTDLEPGEAPCPLCQTGNAEERRFCRRCGNRLGEQPAPAARPHQRWLAQLVGWWDDHTPNIQIWPEGRPLPSRRAVLGTVAAVAAVLALLGPWQPSRASVREHFFPKPRYIIPDRVRVQPKELYDGSTTAAVVAAGAKTGFSLNRPVDLFKVGIEVVNRAPGDALPQTIQFSFPDTSHAPCLLTYSRNSGFQSATCKASRVQSIDLIVTAPASGDVQINEVEFFERS
jgi:hypothetical protein